jgi:hypothetical protein
VTFKFPAIDITDRADGRVPAWNDADQIHKYVEPASVAGLDYETATLGSDQTIAAANTVTDITGVSVTLDPGSWLIFGMALFKRGSTDSIIALHMTDAANAQIAAARGGVTSAATNTFTHLQTFAPVVIASATTYKLRARFVSGTTGVITNSDSLLGGSCTRIMAVKIA